MHPNLVVRSHVHPRTQRRHLLADSLVGRWNVDEARKPHDPIVASAASDQQAGKRDQPAGCMHGSPHAHLRRSVETHSQANMRPSAEIVTHDGWRRAIGSVSSELAVLQHVGVSPVGKPIPCRRRTPDDPALAPQFPHLDRPL